MSRAKETTVKKVKTVPETQLSAEERIEFLANIIVDCILEDQASGQKLLIYIEEGYGNKAITAS